MTEQQTRAPVEDLILFAAQDMSESAYESFVEGQLTRAELKNFYDTLKAWTAASESILDAMHKIGIQE